VDTKWGDGCWATPSIHRSPPALSSATSGLARGLLYGRLASLEHERRGGGDHRYGGPPGDGDVLAPCVVAYCPLLMLHDYCVPVQGIHGWADGACEFLSLYLYLCGDGA
jgi:hypothetical protein